MQKYILKRLVMTIPTLLLISVVAFLIIELPPGDYLTTYITTLESQGFDNLEELADRLREQYGLDKPVMVRYFMWLGNVLRGDLGRSFVDPTQSVAQLIGERLPITMSISLLALLVTYIIAIPAGVFAAIKQHTWFDYLFTFISFIGLAIPAFLLALLVMYGMNQLFGVSMGGLFSREYANAPWSFGKFMDLLGHLWVPVIVIGMNGTAALIRTMRGVMLDELSKDYMRTARAKGITYYQAVARHALPLALNPILSTIGWSLPGIFSGSIIVSIVLDLPTIGPLLLGALQNQDMYIAASLILIMSSLTVIGTLISDLLIAAFDPRIKYE